MDIRAAGKDYQKLKKAYDKNAELNKDIVSINEDSKAIIPVIMVKNEDGSLVEWTRGMENITSFIEKGYVEIKRNCPFRPFFGKCKPKKCGFYVVKNGTGDCMLAWTGVQVGVIS